MVNVSWLDRAMDAAGFDTNKALAEASGVSAQTVARVLKRGVCNASTAERLQTACGEHRIGPLMQAERSEDDRPSADGLPFPGDIWYRDEVADRTVLTGTRLMNRLVKWGAEAYEADGTRVYEEWGYDDHWTARAEGLSAAKEA